MNSTQELESQLVEARAAYEEKLKKLRAVPKGAAYFEMYLVTLQEVSEAYTPVRVLERALRKTNGFYS